MSQKDLQDLLKAIEDLARTGNRDMARQMLAQLMQMLENMKMMAGREATEWWGRLSGPLHDRKSRGHRLQWFDSGLGIFRS